MQSVHWSATLLLCLAAAPPPSSCEEPPLFQDVSTLLGHRHHDELFDDFERQSLLYHRLSQLGPGVSWVDLNNDGRVELVIASGKGGRLAVFEYSGTNSFTPLNLPLFTQPTTRDETTVLAFPEADGTTALLIGFAGYEDGLAEACVREFRLSNGTIQDVIPAQPFSIGPLALGDIDGDGALDLFVGGRVVPGRYPEPASSLIFQNRAGKLVLDETNSAMLRNVGLVSGAVWTDLNGDGFPELVLACEWGPLRIFRNDHGRLAEWNPQVKILNPQPTPNPQPSTLNQLTGWWNGVTAGDFDGDGRMDLAVSNWGLNSQYQIRDGNGPRIYYGAWGASGEIEPMEAAFDNELSRWLPRRDLNSVRNAMPWVREKFATHRAYAGAGIEAILGEQLKDARVIEANCLETTVFLNRGTYFETGSLPINVQFSPAFSVNVADFDGDGNEDLFLSQNFFDVREQMARNDAGRGLLLKGNGKGGFTALDGSVSGIEVYGEQRGAAVGDYDGDGRPDLAVSQNGAETKLFHNVRARPGLRVRLKGPPGNPTGIGAIIRLAFGQRWGPAREIHAGSGYWSQDSAVQVMGTPETPTKVQVLWPGGGKTETEVPKDARDLEIRQP
jgi:hypothetical protein